MLRYALLRVGGAVPSLLGLTVLAFVLMHMLPGDPARLAAGLEASAQTVALIRHQLFLDRPLPVQYWHYLTQLVHGDLGTSFATGQPVAKEAAQRWPVTFSLSALAMVAASALGIVLGTLAAVHRGRAVDVATSVLAVSGVSMPVFWLGLLLIYYFSVRLHWLPSLGLSDWKSYVMPCVCLTAYPLALIARMTRATLLDVLAQDFVRTARAKGVGPRVVIYRHALRNALLPTLTVIGLSLGYLLGGAVMTETVFSINGVGRWVVDGVLARDVPVVQAATLIIGAMFMLANLLVDLGYAWLDPRVRYQ